MRSTVFVAAFLLAYGGEAQAQFKIDMTDDEVRRHFNVIYMKDLTVKDIAYLYTSNICLENGRVFVASNESPKKRTSRKYDHAQGDRGTGKEAYCGGSPSHQRD